MFRRSRIISAIAAAAAIILGGAVVSAPTANAAAALPSTNGKVLALASYVVDGVPWLAVCGNFTQVAGQAASGVATVNLNTGALGVKGKFTGGWVDTCIVRNGNIYAGGTFTAVSGASRNKVAAIGLTGTLRSWKPNVGGLRVYSISSDSSKIYLASSNAIRAVNLTSGANVWVTPVTGGAPRSILAVTGHNRLYIGGGFNGFDNAYKPMLGAVALGTGRMDTTWNPSLRPNSGTGEWPTFDGENVLALAYDQVNNRVCAGIAGHATNALGCFNAYLGPRDFMKSTVGDVQAVLVANGYYFVGYHRSVRTPVCCEWIANAWTAYGADVTWGDGFSGPSDPEQGGPYGNDRRNGGINAFAIHPGTGQVIAGGAFTIPGRSLAVV